MKRTPHGTPTSRWRTSSDGQRRARWLELITTAALVGGCGHTALSVPTSAPATAGSTTTTTLAPGVHLHRGVLEDWGPANRGDVSNAGFVVGDRCVAVIDTGGTIETGRRLLARIRQVTSLPVCYVISTHAHPDHVLGHQAFIEARDSPDANAQAIAPIAADPVAAASDAAKGGGPTFVGHARLAAALSVRGPFYLNALRRDFGPDLADATRIVMPSLLVKDTLTLDLGGRRLQLKAWPTAHTDADLTVWDETTGTLFLGDLLFVDHTPVLDGRLKGWLAALGQLRTMPVKIAVPGHGAPQTDWPAALDPEQRYLETLQADVRRALKQQLTLSQTVNQVLPDRQSWRLLDVFHQRNVTAAYAELEWED